MRRLISPAILILLWEILARSGMVNPFVVPAPSVVAVEFIRMIASLELLSHLADSGKRIVVGFTIAVVIGVLAGVLMARSKFFELAIDPVVELVRPVSPLAIYPLAILWFGIGDSSKVFLVALACSFPVILNTYAGVRSIDVNLLRAGRSLGASRMELVRKIVLPGCLPQVFTGIRISWGIALIVIVAAEMIGGTTGIGYMVLDAQQTFRVDRVFVGILVIGLLGFATDQAFRWLRGALLPWYTETRE